MLNIIGAGGLGQEVSCLVELCRFVVDDEYFQNDNVNGIEVIPMSKASGNCVIAIGNPADRMRIAKNKFNYITIISDKAYIGRLVTFAEGTIVMPNSSLTTDIRVGRHCVINVGVTVGHNSRIGDFVTLSPGVNISGNVTIGNNVYIGTNVCIREKLSVCDNVLIGMGSVVVKSITEPGTYFGNPAKLKK